MEQNEADLYDVAISLRSGDEQIACEIFSKISSEYKVFFYSEEQPKIAGTVGVDTFQRIFRNSKIVVVLFRDGWGKTKFTAVEEGAIKDRFFNDMTLDFLLLVELDKSNPPDWLPKSFLRFNLERYKIEGLIGAIAEKINSLSATKTQIDSIEYANLVNKQLKQKRERESLLARNRNFIASEWENIVSETKKKLERYDAMENKELHFRFDKSSWELFIRSVQCSLRLQVLLDQPEPFDPPKLRCLFYRRMPIAPGEFSVPAFGGEPAYPERTRIFIFDVSYLLDWCWTPEDRKGRSLPSAELVDSLFRDLLKFCANPK